MNKIQFSHITGAKLFLLLLILLVGIVLAVVAVVNSQQIIYNEQDSHLTNLASCVDHNISGTLEFYANDLETLAHSEGISRSEAVYFSTGDTADLRKELEASPLTTANRIAHVLVEKDGQMIACSCTDEPVPYSILSDKTGQLFFCTDETSGERYLAVSHASGNGLVYYGLFDLESFYRDAVVYTIYDDYWIVLYNEDFNLILNNDDDIPGNRMLTKEEIQQRNDGYSFLLDYQQAGIAGSGSYSFTDTKGNYYSNRISVIPSALSSCGCFCIGVAVYDQDIVEPTRALAVTIVIAAFLIAFSTATLVFILLHNRRKERELADENAALEKKNELTTQLLSQQEELAHHQNLETIGTLTAGVAHEFNNLLSPIMGNSLLILEESEPEGSIYDKAVEIYEASLRAKDLVANISKLSRKSVVRQMTRIAPQKLIESALNVAAPSIPHQIEIEKKCDAAQLILGHENQLVQALLNLILNSVQAMSPNEGKLIVSAYDKENTVCLSVSDTGGGIPEESLQKIFEPFYTTKDSGKGTGLGLAITQRTIVDHGGTIEAINTENGAVFIITLPAEKQKEPAQDQ